MAETLDERIHQAVQEEVANVPYDPFNQSTIETTFHTN